MRTTLARLLDLPLTRNIIMGVILFNAIILGLETSDVVMARAGGVISALDTLCLAIFTAEIVVKIYARGFAFFKSGWGLFDFVIIGMSYSPAGAGLSVLRALRILRLLRVVSVVPSLRRVVEAFIMALPGMASVFFLTGIIFYIGAVIATKLYGDTFPEWFGTLGGSLYSLFQVMTLESWSMGIVRPVMETHPNAWLFFIPFILVTAFAVMNLVVGLIVNSMQDAHAEEANASTQDHRDELMARLDRIERALGK
ncbi:ion transporter [Pacificibacter marinus]|uniref:Ion transport protein n=1 Tax=Pacificibacter marinus TaxID=658057 RepID=A0A1Y5S9I4_9RHOB|nr:ion transporter [Pacificibacter marinus]SEK80302.1 voltage-gated sodium channel [Pacificibacter marinus]SLN32754.1 Ion transport protein [Pacificibacter marinus]